MTACGSPRNLKQWWRITLSNNYFIIFRSCCFGAKRVKSHAEHVFSVPEGTERG